MPNSSFFSASGTLNLSSDATRSSTRALKSTVVMCSCPHALSSWPGPYSARTAGGRADLVDQILFEPRNIRGRKPFTDPLVVGDVRHKLVNDRRDGRLSSETIIERLFHPLTGLAIHR